MLKSKKFEVLKTIKSKEIVLNLITNLSGLNSFYFIIFPSFRLSMQSVELTFGFRLVLITPEFYANLRTTVASGQGKFKTDIYVIINLWSECKNRLLIVILIYVRKSHR